MNVQRLFTRKAAVWLPALLSLYLLAGCDQGRPGAPQENAGVSTTAPTAKGDTAPDRLLRMNAAQSREAGIRTQPVTRQADGGRIRVTAVIEPDQDRLAHVAPLVPGRLAQVSATLGARVRSGQVLAVVNSVDAGQARAAYAEAQSGLSLAQANFARAERLYRQQIMAQKDYLRARADLQQARAKLRAAQERLGTYGLSSGAEHGPSLVPVRAPIAGTVIEKKAVLGELAGPDRSLFTIADLSRLWIEADLFEQDLAKITRGTAAEIQVAAYPGELFKGRVTYISPVMDPQTRTIKARVEVRNADGRLKPNMFATVMLDAPSSARVLRVPETAVLLLQGQPTVFVATGAGFAPRQIRVGERANGRVIITGGLAPGARVVVQGAYALKARLLKSQIGEAE